MTLRDRISMLIPGYKLQTRIHGSFIQPLSTLPIGWHAADAQHIVAKGPRPFSHVQSRQLKRPPKICPSTYLVPFVIF